MEKMDELLRLAVEKSASDIFIGAGRCVLFKLDGVITPQSENALNSFEADELLTRLYELANRPMAKFTNTGDDDFPVSVPDLARFRVCAYRQRNTLAAAIRVVLFDIPDRTEINIPDEVMGIANEKHGIVLVTGSAGSGKTTTLACIIDAINQSRNCHIITLEDPIEYLHTDKKSHISQREIPTDSVSYITAIRACLRQAPDIILIGEMRDQETIRTAMTAAETGHLVISTLHTVGAVNSIDRIIDVFAPEQQQQIRMQMSMLLRTVVSQRMLPKKEGGFIPAFEIMNINSAIRNLIREGKTHQIDGVIQTSAKEGMISMDASVYRLFQKNLITSETAVGYSVNPTNILKLLGSLNA